MKFGIINMQLTMSSLVSMQYRVSMGTGADGSIWVHRSEKNGLPDIEFKIHESCLHYWDPSSDIAKTGTNTKTKKIRFVETVEDRKKLYSKRQLKMAEIARAGLHNAGFPSEQDFRLMVQNGHIANCPMQVDDVDRAKYLHGKDVGLLKWKTTRNKPLPVINNIVPAPKDILNSHKDVFITVDLFYVHKIVFLVTYSRRICLTTVKWLDTRKITGVFTALCEDFNVYRRRGFIITLIHGDNEFAPLQPFLDEMPESQKLILTAKGDHVPETERWIRVIEERCRALRHSLQFNKIPLIITMYIVLQAVGMLNFFPQTTGVSETLSPTTIISGKRLDWKRNQWI
jgi:hypothetical protein